MVKFSYAFLIIGNFYFKVGYIAIICMFFYNILLHEYLF